MSNKKEYLFNLVQAMSKTEKRYFAVEAKKNQKKGGDYLKLYDELNKRGSYEEELFKKKFGKKLSQLKNSLYEALLKSIRDYHNNQSQIAKAKDMVLEAKLLFERNLLHQALGRLDKAMKIAQEMDDSFLQLEVLNVRRMVNQAMTDGDFEKKLVRILKDIAVVKNKLVEELEFREIYDTLFFLVRKKSEQQTLNARKNLKQKYHDKLSTPTLSDTARYVQIKANLFYYSLMKQDKKSFEVSLSTLAWWEDHPQIKKEHAHTYIIDYFNHIGVCQEHGKLDLQYQVMQEISSLSAPDTHHKNLVLYKNAIHQFAYSTTTGKFDGVMDLIYEFDRNYKKLIIPKRAKLPLLINGAFSLFILEEFAHTQEWLLKILVKERTDSRQDIQRIARILYLYVLLAQEGDYYDVTEKAIRAHLRFLKSIQVDKNVAYEHLYIEPVQRLLKATAKEEKEIWQELANQRLEDNIRLGLGSLIMSLAKLKLDGTPIIKSLYG